MREPSVYIQYKGTDICLDFTCECGFDAHYDGYGAYVLHCTACGAFYEMPQFPVPVRLSEEPRYAINLWDEDTSPDLYENPDKYPTHWKRATDD